jgi:hypothetical protein
MKLLQWILNSIKGLRFFFICMIRCKQQHKICMIRMPWWILIQVQYMLCEWFKSPIQHWQSCCNRFGTRSLTMYDYESVIRFIWTENIVCTCCVTLKINVRAFFILFFWNNFYSYFMNWLRGIKFWKVN